MQLVGEVQLLARRDPNGLGWAPEDIEKMASKSLPRFPQKWCEGTEETAEVVCEYLENLDEESKSLQRPPAVCYRLPQVKAIKARSWITQMPRPVWRIIEHRRIYDLGNILIPAEPRIESLELLVKEPPWGEPIDYENSFYGQRPSDADETGLGVGYYRHLTSNSKSPLFGDPFAVFRRLGIALWGDVRLKAMGLVDTYPDEFVAAEYFAWRSLVPEKELAEAADRIKNLGLLRSMNARGRRFGY